MASPRPPWQVQLALPPTWFGLTCNEKADQEQVPQQVDEYIEQMGNTTKWRTRKLRAGMIGSLLSWSAGAAGLGAESAAMRWDEDETFGMGIATMMVRRLDREYGPAERELDRLRTQLAEELPNDEYPPRVSDADLAVGRGLRMEAVRQPSDVDGRQQHLQLVVDYWVPVEDVDVIQMTFGTTNLALAAVMAEEFDIIATNFRYQVEAV